jgi:hypothetical protein
MLRHCNIHMSARRASESSLRLDHLETSRLAWAFALSVAVHLLAWGTYAEGRRLGVWEKTHWPAWMQALARPLARTAKKEEAARPIDREPPLVFVDVSPRQATTEPPKNPLFYSDKNSQAANPDADKDTDVPKITGAQTHVPQTEDVPRNRFDKLQPAPPVDRNPVQEEARAKPVLSPGDLTLAKPELNPRPDTGTAEEPRPRRVAEVRARLPGSQVPGQKMKQEGGVRRQALIPSFDVKETAFGAYDAAFVDAVRQRWYDLLDQRNYAQERSGKVVLQFHLKFDGTITDMEFKDNTVGDMLGIFCRKAVEDPAPYDKWSREMRLMVGKDFREIRFTFYYN